MPHKVLTGAAVREGMAALARARQAKYTTLVTEDFPKLSSCAPGAIIGTYSWTLKSEKLRYLKPHAVMDIGFGSQTVTEIVRDWISAKYPRLKARGAQIEGWRQNKRQAPIYCRPGVWANCSLLDLSSCYLSIVRCVGYDCDYYPDKWLGLGAPVDDFPLPYEKHAYASLVSMGHSSDMRIWNGQKIVTIPKNGQNDGLYCLIIDTLNAIAIDMLSVGAIYVYSDGYIVPDRLVSDGVKMLKSWGIPFKIKRQGFTHVVAVNNYRIGGYQTRFYGLCGAPLEYTALSSHVSPVWLKERLLRFSTIRAKNYPTLTGVG